MRAPVEKLFKAEKGMITFTRIHARLNIVQSGVIKSLFNPRRGILRPHPNPPSPRILNLEGGISPRQTILSNGVSPGPRVSHRPTRLGERCLV
jgi:hypothetical protein